MLGFIRLDSKIAIYTVFLMLIKSTLADEHKVVTSPGRNSSERDVFEKALETSINGTMDSDRIRDKLYRFFEDLRQAGLNHSSLSDKTQSNNEHFLIKLIFTSFGWSESSEAPLSRPKREDDCREVGIAHKGTLEKMEQEIEIIKIMHNNEVGELRKRSCRARCALECQKNKCSPSNCPEIPKDANKCSNPLPCPKGCTAHWTKPPPMKDLKEAKKRTKREKEGRKKNRVNHKVSARRKKRKKSSNRIGSDVDKSTSELMGYHRQLSHGFRRLQFILDHRFPIIDQRLMDLGDKLRLESVVDMIELLDYFMEDITYLTAGFLYDYPKIARIYYSQPNKNRLIMDCIKSILGNIIPSSSKEQILKISRLSPEERLDWAKTNDRELELEYEILKTAKNEDRLKMVKIEECEGKKCSDYCPELLDELEECSFKCANNLNCGRYQCFCKKFTNVRF